ncbi:MAG: ATP-binding cassette domain-containing protein [Bacteroidaceae bacterium]|nr:ATP-binding cassette domain-containing protein [Bacteroidaceae bacterium]
MIEVKNLSFAYSTEKVLDNISTVFGPGRIYGLLGANGVGKSTMFKLLCGLLTTKQGTIEIDGCSPAGRKPSFLSKIFYVPEDFEGPDMSIRNYADGVSQFYPNYDNALFGRLLSVFEIDANRKFTSLSLGQRKRAILALALSLKTDYLFLDEPTNGLDIPSKAEFRKMVAAAMDEQRTIIISTHQVRDVENLLDHIMILDKRAVLLDRSVSEIQSEYTFDITANVPEGALYVEPGLGGCCSISKNTTGEESRINIELLFNYINSIK